VSGLAESGEAPSTGGRRPAPTLPGVGAGGSLAGLVHLVVIGSFLARGHARTPPKKVLPAVQTQLVSLESLVRKGRPLAPKELPRLQNAPAPVAEKPVLLNPALPEPPPPEVDTKKEEERKAQEEKERRKKMLQALRSLDPTKDGAGRPDDPRRFASTSDLPVGREDGSELGTSSTGRLQAGYSDLVRAAINKEWKYSFIPEEELRRLCGKVKFFVDRERFLIRYSWERRSGNPEFDTSIEGILRRFARDGDLRFPPFPDDGSFGASVGFLYKFRKDEGVPCP